MRSPAGWVAGLAAFAGLALTLGVGSPAHACDYAAALSLDAVVEAGPGGSVSSSGRAAPVLGVVEYTVAGQAPALVPVTSQRASYLEVRSWGEVERGPDRHPPAPAGTSPYLGGLGDSCGGYRTPPRGASILHALVAHGAEIDRQTIGPEEFQFHFPDGVSDEMRAELDAVFGPATVHEYRTVDRLRAALSPWTPHLLLFGGIIVVVGAIVGVRRSWRTGA